MAWDVSSLWTSQICYSSSARIPSLYNSMALLESELNLFKKKKQASAMSTNLALQQKILPLPSQYWPRSLRWKTKLKHCSGWFVVRENTVPAGKKKQAKKDGLRTGSLDRTRSSPGAAVLASNPNINRSPCFRATSSYTQVRSLIPRSLSCIHGWMPERLSLSTVHPSFSIYGVLLLS